jgi:hypothetical protein
VKPAAGRGAIRVDDPEAFDAALARFAAAASGGPEEGLLVEAFIPGWELVLQGVLTAGALHVLALLASPDAPHTPDAERLAGGVVAHAAAALGLRHGPLHAVCRVNDHGVFLVTLAPWAIEARLARVLRFATRAGAARSGRGLTLAEILLRHAIGESLDDYGREA